MCKGKTPTINELKSLLTPDLVGDKFKRTFTLFAIASFLCPTSYDCISTDYYSAVECPNEISSYDWCSVVLDKLINSIDSYQRSVTRTSTTALGGCILALVIIYFELLDVPNHNNHEAVPRLKFWSTDMIKAFETLDAKDADGCIFGRLPLKENRQTILLTSATTSEAPSGSRKETSKCVPASCNFKAKFGSLSNDIANEIMTAIQPILSQYCDTLHTAWHCQPDVTCQDSMIGGRKLLSDHGKRFLAPDYIVGDICQRTSEHVLSSKLVKFKDTFAAKIEQVGTAKTSLEASGDDAAKVDPIVIKEDSIPLEIQANKEEDRLAMKMDKTVEERSASKGHVTISNNATSSFLHVPSYSQDSSNTYSYDDCSGPPLHKDNVFESSNLQQRTSQLRPFISKDQNGLDRVFASHHCTNIKTSVISGTASDKNDDSSTFGVTTPEKGTRVEDFDFWGHRMDSDFEVNPPKEAGVFPNPDAMLSSSSSKKRPRSLNEAVLDLWSSRRVDKRSSTEKSTKQFSLNDDSIADHASSEFGDPMQSNNIEDIEDVNLIDHISQSTPCKTLRYHINFDSTLVEKEVFKDIIDRIPFTGPRPRVVEMNKNWVDHKTFGLSMRVYGTVSSYVIDVMGKAVMTEEYEKNKANLLPSDFWYRHIVRSDKAKLLQKKNADAQDLSKLFTEPNQGYRLDLMSMVFVPVLYDQFWYLVVANFRNGRFEVLIPNQRIEEVESDAQTIILNFKRMFNYACPHSSKVHIWKMHTAYRSVTTSTNNCDSGIFVMKLIKSHDGESQHLFKPEQAKNIKRVLVLLFTHSPIQ